MRTLWDALVKLINLRDVFDYCDVAAFEHPSDGGEEDTECREP